MNEEIPDVLTPDVFLISSDAIKPKRRKALGVGYDIFCPQTTVIPAGSKKLIDTDIRIKLPPHMLVKIEPISISIYMDTYIVNCDKIDKDGTETLMVLMSNKVNKDFVLPRGTLLGRMIYSVIKEHEQMVAKEV
jgi:dUTPase